PAALAATAMGLGSFIAQLIRDVGQTGNTGTETVGPFPAIWWVATPSLLPPVALAGLVIILRLTRVRSTSLFLLLFMALALGRYLISGAEVLPALELILYYYPVGFIAGVMLSEPLTSPARGKQRAI